MIPVPFRPNDRAGDVIIHAHDDFMKAHFISGLNAAAEQFAFQMQRTPLDELLLKMVKTAF